MEKPVYAIAFARLPPPLADDGNGPAWRQAATADIVQFRRESRSRLVHARVRMLYDREGLYGLFHVDDHFVRCVHSGHQPPVCRDSCVEFFVRPYPDRGYFNFEFSCGGHLYAAFIRDWRRVPGGFQDFTPLTPEECARVSISHSLPSRVEPELREPVSWSLGFHIPFDLLAGHLGPLPFPPSDAWTANFYKCGDDTSQPHWAAWAAVPELNFHRPDAFGRLTFGPVPDNRHATAFVRGE